MSEYRLVEDGDNLKDSINRILKRDAGTEKFGTRIRWTDFDGNVLDRQTGRVIGTSEPTLVIKNGAGEHLLIQKSTDGSTVFEVQDAGVTIATLLLTGDLHVPGEFAADGNVVLGNAITDTTLVSGPLTANATLNVKGNFTAGDANTDTALFAGPVTMNESLNVKGNSVFGDAEADTVTIVDWVLQVTSNDLLFKDDGNNTVVKICDASSTYQLDVAIGDFHVADDAVIDGDISAGRGVFGGTTFSSSEELRVVGQSLMNGSLTVSTGGISVTGSSVFADAVAIQDTATIEVVDINGSGRTLLFSGTSQTATTVGGAGGASALPATPRGYIKISVGGVDRKLAFYDD